MPLITKRMWSLYFDALLFLPSRLIVLAICLATNKAGRLPMPTSSNKWLMDSKRDALTMAILIVASEHVDPIAYHKHATLFQ